MIPGVSYQKIDDDGLHVVINGETQVLAVDNVVICAGQEPNRALAQPLMIAENCAFNWRLRCGYGAGRTTRSRGDTAGAGDLKVR